MPYLGCRKCHHEWECAVEIKYIKKQKCDWCGADNPKILEKETPLEKLTKALLENDDLLDWMLEIKEKKK